MNGSAWNKRFFASTRGRIVALLRRASRTVNELAETLDLTDNAVRAHLTSLERDGLVQQSGTRRGSRKPHQSFGLTPDAEQLFSKAYEPVLGVLLHVLEERYPPEEVAAILNAAGERAGAGLGTELQGRPVPERVDRAVDLLGELGGLAEKETAGDRVLIRGYSCPLAGVVPGHPEACRMAESLLSAVIGRPVKERCEKGSSPKCCFEVMTSPS
jgi:predicted ArsR family transcriptional regulator